MFTVIGALIAAFTSSWNLMLQLRGKRDNFVVRLGSVSPSTAQETMMNVVCYSDHPITLTDWGFIEADGTFSSFLESWETGTIQSHEIITHGVLELSGFGKTYETGYVRRKLPFGAYAISATQKTPCLCFNSDMPFRRRVWIRLRLWFQPHYLA